MEIKVNEIQVPEKISFNYEELKQELSANSLSDLTEKQFRNINDHWEDIKKVC